MVWRPSLPLPGYWVRPRLLSVIAGELLFRATRLLIASLDLRCDGLEQLRTLRREGRPIIFVGWHGQYLLNFGAFRRILGPEARGAIMVRNDPNGLVLIRFSRRMNVAVVSLDHDLETPHWGQAVVEMARLVRQGHDGMIAVDGPEGPAHRVKPGAAVLAQKTGAVLVPVGGAASRSLQLRYRWDRQLIPLPGSRTVIHLGAPVDASSSNGARPNVDELVQRIAEAIDAATVRAEELCRKASASNL